MSDGAQTWVFNMKVLRLIPTVILLPPLFKYIVCILKVATIIELEYKMCVSQFLEPIVTVITYNTSKSLYITKTNAIYLQGLHRLKRSFLFLLTFYIPLNLNQEHFYIRD